LAADSCSEPQSSALSRARFAHLDRNAAIAQSDIHPFCCGPRSGEFLPGCRQESVHSLVLGIGIVVKQNEISDFCIARNFHSLQPAGMPPPFAARSKLLGGILRIVNQTVRSLGPLP